MLYKNYLNCYELILANILEEFNFSHEALFFQSGFALYKEKNQDIFKHFRITNKVLDYNSLISNKFVIKKEELFVSKKEFLILVQKAHKQKIVLAVDTYYLPYCRSYLKDHYYHYILVDSVKENAILITDSFYKYEGDITHEVMDKAISLEAFGQDAVYNIMIFTPLNEKKMEKEDLKFVSKMNIDLMTEDCKYSFLEDHDIFVGIIGIKKLMRIVEYAIENRDYDIVDRLFDEVGAIVHSRRQLVDYANYNDSESLKTVFFESYQRWMILSNVLLRILLKKEFNLSHLKNIKNIFDKVIEAEQRVIIEFSNIVDKRS